MKYLALNQVLLSRFSHHWFWGLQVDKMGGATLYDAAKYLESHPKKQDEIALQVESKSRLIGLIRFIYWIFNIGNYRNNYYALHAYVSLQHYEQGVNMLSPEEQRKAAAVGGFILLALVFRYSTPLRQCVYDAITPGLDWFKDKLMLSLSSELPLITVTEPSSAQSREELVPLIANRFYLSSECKLFKQPGLEENSAESDSLESENCFIVKSHLLFAFKRLGLTPKAGDYISLATLKAAYRESLRRSHPDKTGLNSAAEFRNVRDAMSFILDGINYRNQQNEAVYNTSAEFKARLEILEQMLQGEIEAWLSLREGVDSYSKRVDRYIQNADRYIQNADRYIQNADKLIEACKQYIARADQYIQNLNEYSEYEATMHHDFFEALAQQEEYEELARAELMALETIIPFASQRTESNICTSPLMDANNRYRFLASCSGSNTPEDDIEKISAFPTAK